MAEGIAGLIVLIGIVIGIVCGVRFTNKTKRLWSDRASKARIHKNQFLSVLNKNEIKINYQISTKSYFGGSTQIDMFVMAFDYDKKIIAFASLVEDSFKYFIVNFSDIKNFAILNGVTNTTVESFTTGYGSGVSNQNSFGGGYFGSSTTSYQKTFVNDFKLKIETKDPYKPAILCLLSRYGINIQSSTYGELINSCEQIKTSLSKIIEENNKDSKK